MRYFSPLLALLITACAAQNPTPQPGQALPTTATVPGDSLVTVAAALRSDALQNLKVFSQSTYGCANPTLVNTTNEKVDGELVLDNAGRLHAGQVTELWQIDACGAMKSLKVLFGSDGKDGHYVAIGEIKE